MTTSPPAIATTGQLRASGHTYRPLRVELRENLLAALAEGRDPWPGIHGFDTTVIPQLERALLAGHDIVLLGERGQGKTRLLRSLAGLLDEWSPVIAGSELGEHPFHPVIPVSVRRASDLGDDLPVAWRHRSERYVEKLATPDTSVADLIGDVDPMKVAEGRSLGDPETIHYGLVPRAHRGIVAINELPDLAERIQVSLLNVMEERDIQIRGYLLRLDLEPRAHHHPPAGPLRRRDPHALPADDRRGGRRHPPGGRPRRRRPRPPAGDPRAVHAQSS
jgi:magnesium chelatase subunit I